LETERERERALASLDADLQAAISSY
jgi:hypothetical protein